MKDMLGDDEFKNACMPIWIAGMVNIPRPGISLYDFNDVRPGRISTGFGNAWYFQPNYIDLGVSDVSKSKGNYNVVIRNIGGYPAPVDMVVKYSDGSSETVHQTPAIWKNDLKVASVELKTKKTITSATLRWRHF